MSVPGNSYEDRKVALLCTYSTGCGKPACDDSSLCLRHHRSEAKRKAADKRHQRMTNRSKGLCAFCDNKSAQYRCAVCRVRSITVKKAGDAASVAAFDEKMERIRARTAVEADGRTRYRGQLRRGRQSVVDLDRQDRELCRTYLAKYEAAIDYARRPEAADVPRIQRDEAVRAANDYLRLAGRFANDILVRNGEPPIVAVPDDDDDDEGGEA